MYCVERTDREGRGGGCAILFRKELTVARCQRPERFANVEVCAVDVLGSVQVRFICAYLAPDLQTELDLGLRYFEYLLFLSQTDLRTVTVGDFNLPHIDWRNLAYRNNPFYVNFFKKNRFSGWHFSVGSGVHFPIKRQHT